MAHAAGNYEGPPESHSHRTGAVVKGATPFPGGPSPILSITGRSSHFVKASKLVGPDLQRGRRRHSLRRSDPRSRSWQQLAASIEPRPSSRIAPRMTSHRLRVSSASRTTVSRGLSLATPLVRQRRRAIGKIFTLHENCAIQAPDGQISPCCKLLISIDINNTGVWYSTCS